MEESRRGIPLIDLLDEMPGQTVAERRDQWCGHRPRRRHGESFGLVPIDARWTPVIDVNDAQPAISVNDAQDDVSPPARAPGARRARW